MLIVTEFKGNFMKNINFIKDCNLNLSLKMLYDTEARSWKIKKSNEKKTIPTMICD